MTWRILWTLIKEYIKLKTATRISRIASSGNSSWMPSNISLNPRSESSWHVFQQELGKASLERSAAQRKAGAPTSYTLEPYRYNYKRISLSCPLCGGEVTIYASAQGDYMMLPFAATRDSRHANTSTGTAHMTPLNGKPFQPPSRY